MTTDQLYIEKLRKAVHDFIQKNWTPSKQISFGDTYDGIQNVLNRNAFYNEWLCSYINSIFFK
jgi:hypothetical protein